MKTSIPYLWILYCKILSPLQVLFTLWKAPESLVQKTGLKQKSRKSILRLRQQSVSAGIFAIRVFPKLYKVANVANKGLHKEKQDRFSQKIVPRWDWTQNFLIIILMLYWLGWVGVC